MTFEILIDNEIRYTRDYPDHEANAVKERAFQIFQPHARVDLDSYVLQVSVSQMVVGIYRIPKLKTYELLVQFVNTENHLLNLPILD